MIKIINFLLSLLSKLSSGFIKNYFIIDFKPSYYEDGLASSHTYFENNKNPSETSYIKGFKTNSSYGHHLRWRVHVACILAHFSNNIKGDIVEFGTNKGLIALAILNYHKKNKINKKFFLFDTFQGRILKYLTKAEKNFKKQPKYEECFEQVQKTFATFRNVKLIRGKLPGTINKVKLNKISFLHIDLNSSKAEILSVTKVWNKINKGGIILLDDYCYSGYLDTKNAWNKFAKEKKISILPLPTGQGIILKN